MNRLILGGVLGVLAAWSAIGLLLTSGWLISRAAEQPPVLYLMVAIVAVRGFGIARGVLRYAERLLTHDGALRLLTKARVQAYEALERRAPAGIGDRRRGDLVSRVVEDVDALQDRLLRVRLPWIITCAAAVATTGVVAWILPLAGVVLAVTVTIVMAGVPALLRVCGARLEERIATLRGEFATVAAETVGSAPELIAYDATSLSRQRFSEASARLRTLERRAAWLSGLGSAVVLLATGAATGALLWIATSGVAVGDVDPVLLAVIALAPIALLEPLDGLPVISQNRARVAGARARLAELDQLPLPVEEPATANDVPEGSAIEVRGLVAGWPDGPDVLQNVDVSLPEGSVVTVTGPSGSGKSTLAAVLLKLLSPRSGTVTLGGVDLATLRGEQVREVVGMLGQDEHVFDTSIRENLRIADPQADDARLWRALEDARLAAFVRGLPSGLDTEVGEHGARLSGGERQRLGLARLLLGRHRVLILDEPTEQLEEDAGAELLDDLLALAGTPSGHERSILLITHQPPLRRGFWHGETWVLAR